MSTEYRVLIQNKFAAFNLGDEAQDGVEVEDPFEQLDQLNKQEPAAKKVAVVAPKAAQTEKALPVEVQQKNEKNSSQKSAPAKSYAPRPDNDKVNQRRPAPRPEGKTWTNDAKPREDRPSFRGKGEPRRGGFRRGAEEGSGKREFDRHSGNEKSGVKPHEKREGGGAHNWGSFKDDINEQVVGDATQEASSSQDDLTKTEAPKDVEVKAPEPEEKQFTLDEWKKMQEQNRMKASFNVRKANEGCQDPKWENMVALKKAADEEEGEEEVEEVEVNKKQTNADLLQFFNPRQGTRGGRGMNRRVPNSDRRVPRDAVKEKVAYNVDDEMEFPSLKNPSDK